MRHNRPDVTKHRIADLVRQLPNKLVRHDQIQPVLPRLTQNTRKAVRREVLKLIHVQGKVRPLVFRHVGATHRRRLELNHKDHTQKLRVQLPYPPLAQVYNQDLLVIHHVTNVESRLRLAQDIAHNLVVLERAKLTHKPPKHLALMVVARLPHFLRPEINHRRVFQVLELLLQVVRIRKHLRHLDESRTIRISHQGQCRIPVPVLIPRPNDARVPGVIQFVEHINRLLDDEILLCRIRKLK